MSSVATIAIGGSVVSGYIQGNAARDAAGIQAGATQAGIDEQRRQFDKVQALLKPYVEAGTTSVTAQGDLLGLNGPEAQKNAMDQLQQSPEFQAMITQGETGILQNASATGGLRGGNVEAALAQFRPQLLAQMIQQRFQNLGGISQLGQASAAGVGSAAQATGSNVANLLTQQGQAMAGATMAEGQGMANIANTGTQLALMKDLGLIKF